VAGRIHLELISNLCFTVSAESCVGGKQYSETWSFSKLVYVNTYSDLITPNWIWGGVSQVLSHDFNIRTFVLPFKLKVSRTIFL